jgi:hypothetical protein
MGGASLHHRPLVLVVLPDLPRRATPYLAVPRPAPCVGPVGVEPTSRGLKVRCSTAELGAPGPCHVQPCVAVPSHVRPAPDLDAPRRVLSRPGNSSSCPDMPYRTMPSQVLPRLGNSLPSGAVLSNAKPRLAPPRAAWSRVATRRLVTPNLALPRELLAETCRALPYRAWSRPAQSRKNPCLARTRRAAPCLTSP